MRFSIEKKVLQDALMTVVAVVPNRTTQPILENILLEAKDNQVCVRATDSSIALDTRIPAQVEAEGSITVPARKFQQLIREMPEGAVEIVLARGNSVQISGGRARVKILGLSADGYPAFPEVDFQDNWGLPGRELCTMIEQVAYAASTSADRPVLQGVLWQFKDGAMRMVATDGHRLALRGITLENEIAPVDLIVPPKVLAQVARLFANEEFVEIGWTGNHIGFRAGNNLVVGTLASGPYPHYEMVIPRENDRIARFNKDAFVAALRRMDVISPDSTHKVRFDFEEGKVTLSVETPDLGGGHEVVEAEWQGTPLSIAFNAGYLLDLFRRLDGETMQATFKASDRAAIFRPEGVDEKLHINIVMPLRLDM